MDDKLFQIIVGVAGTLGTFWMKAIWDGLKEQRAADQALVTKVHALETLVTGNYVHKDEFIRWTEHLSQKLDKTQDQIMDKLDTVVDKLDRKVDKENCEACVPGRWTGLERRGN